MGALLALAASQLFRKQMMMIDVLDAVAYVAAMVVVLAACLGASLIPAWRAARLNPMSMLRAD